MKKTLRYALVLSVICSCGSPAFAQTSNTASAAGPVSGTNEKDGKFLSDLMAVNGYELMLIKLTLQKAQNPELRSGGGKMLADHQRLDAELNSYANRLNFGMDPEKREKYADKISKWDSKPAGNEWDADIVEELVDIHKDGIDMLNDAVKDIKDPEFKRVIEQANLKMHDHLNMLTPLKGKIKHENAGLAPAADVQTANMDNNAAIVNKMADGNKKDAKFFSDLMANNLYQLNLMELILKKGQSNDLKSVAQRMMEDHQRLAEKLRGYAQSKSYGIEPDKGGKYNEKIAKWTEKKGGMEWDADMIEELNDLHKDNVDMLQDAQTDVKDETFKMILSGTLSIEKAHLQMVTPLKEKVKKPWKDKN